ncbi:hypothetical protein MXB_1059 [Myxobolus squamalis]|nr:hypothetical protein MXB_1059 [Myxobolus squamalis]
MDCNRFYHELEGKSGDFWNTIFTKYFDLNQCCIVKAIPKQYDIEDFEIFDVPLAMQIDDIRSNILSVTLCICLGKVEKEMLYYLPLASTFPIEMPIVRKGVLMMHDDVKKELDHVFFQRNSDIGWGSGLFNVGILSYYYFLSLKRIQKFLRTGSNIQAHLACDFKKLCQLNRSPHSIWQLNFSEYALYESNTPRTPSHFNYDQIENQTFYHQIIPLSSCDSSYLIQTIPSIRSFRDPDYPALTVLLEFLSAFEGPLWKKLRGKGLAYSAIIFCEPSDGLLYFKISQSSNIIQAYIEGVDIMRLYSDGSTNILQDELESAISGTIFEAVNQESNICDAALLSMIAQLKGLDHEFHREFIKNVSKVTVKDMELMAKKHLKSIVDACCSHIAISCPNGELSKIIAGFKEINISLEQYAPPDDNEDLIVG